MLSEEWRKQYDEGHYRLAADILRQMGECDDVEGLLALGSMYLYGMHLFDCEADFVRFMESTPDEQQRSFWESTEQFRLDGVALLERASQKGSWPASQNLATYYSCNVKGLSEAERSAKAKYYYGLVERQRSV